MNQLQIRISENRRSFEPGDELTGNVSWQLDEAPRSVELRLFWFTRGKGTQDVGVVQTLNFDHPLQSESRSFQLRLPDSPYSFSGKLISLTWGLELIASPAKCVERVEFNMAPGGREILLEALPAKPRNRLLFTGDTIT